MGIRLDRALVERGLARSRGQAQELITSGAVLVNGSTATRSSLRTEPEDRISAASDAYASRGARKLSGALDDLRVIPTGRALDAGASTGGFTQVLLERGCERVYAVDVGTDQLAQSLRDDPRVVVREQTNLRELTLGDLEGSPVDVVVADLSFIPLGLVLDRLVAVSTPEAELLLLVKPQFEVGRAQLGKNGVVRDPALRRRAVQTVADAARALDRPVRDCVRSRHPGPAGNVEFFVRLRGNDPVERDPLAPVDFT